MEHNSRHSARRGNLRAAGVLAVLLALAGSGGAALTSFESIRNSKRNLDAARSCASWVRAMGELPSLPRINGLIGDLEEWGTPLRVPRGRAFTELGMDGQKVALRGTLGAVVVYADLRRGSDGKWIAVPTRIETVTPEEWVAAKVPLPPGADMSCGGISFSLW